MIRLIGVTGVARDLPAKSEGKGEKTAPNFTAPAGTPVYQGVLPGAIPMNTLEEMVAAWAMNMLARVKVVEKTKKAERERISGNLYED